MRAKYAQYPENQIKWHGYGKPFPLGLMCSHHVSIAKLGPEIIVGIINCQALSWVHNIMTIQIAMRSA